MILRHILMFGLAILGYGILIVINWKLALGVFLINWAINLEQRIKREE